MNSNFLDLFIILVLFLSSLLGAYRGMVNIVVSLLSFIATIFLSIKIQPYVLFFIEAHIVNDTLQSIISFAISFIFSLTAISVLVTKILGVLKSNDLGLFDRIIGLILGVIRGYIIASVIVGASSILANHSYIGSKNLYELITKYDNKNPHHKQASWFSESELKPKFMVGFGRIITVLPKKYLESISFEGSQEFRDDLGSKKKKNGPISSTVEMPMDEDLNNSIKEIINNK
jgi:membrane protein required for colicin V production